MSAAKIWKKRMCLCVKNQMEAEKVCQPIAQGLAMTRRLQACAGQVATEALSVITDQITMLSTTAAPGWRTCLWKVAPSKHETSLFKLGALVPGTFCDGRRHSQTSFSWCVQGSRWAGLLDCLQSGPTATTVVLLLWYSVLCRYSCWFRLWFSCVRRNTAVCVQCGLAAKCICQQCKVSSGTPQQTKTHS